MSDYIKVGLVQFCARRKVEDNIETVSAMVEEAAGNDARFILTPEMTNLMEIDREKLLSQVTVEENDAMAMALSGLAHKHKIWLLAGSLALRTSCNRMVNRSLLFGPNGALAARYDKIHMFDVELGNGESYCESATYEPGSEAVVTQTDFGALGMTICYDVRFAGLYRALAQAGASFISVPSAFTRPTGKAHWQVLLRARAIETGAFVLAPAQCGMHETGRGTYGHSLIIDPWGEILAEADDEPGIIYADCDPALVEQARTRLQTLKHDRHFEPPVAVETETPQPAKAAAG